MAGHEDPKSLRRLGPEGGSGGRTRATMRPGKTAEDKRIGAWASKQERNARQAMYRESAAGKRK